MLRNYIIAMVTAVASTAFAGQSVTTIAAPTVPASAPAWGVELAGVYNFGLNKGVKTDWFSKKNHINGVGGDITGVYNFDDSNAVTLRFGYTYGQDKFAVSHVGEITTDGHVKESIHTFYIMPGYRYTYNINEKWSVYAGASVGLANGRLCVADTKHDIPGGTHQDTTTKAHKSAWGFAYAVEVGGRYAIDTNWEVFAALSFSGNTASPKVKLTPIDGYPQSLRGVRQTWLGARLGVGYKF